MMARQLDYYTILQVHPVAEKEVIDAAYRKLAAKYHPDVSHDSNTAERMKQINAAYEVLSDPVKRTSYDATRHASPSPDIPPQAGSAACGYFPHCLADLHYDQNEAISKSC